MSEVIPQTINVPLVWVGVDDLPILTATHFIIQSAAPEEILLTLGQVGPPILMGTPEQQAEQAQNVSFVRGRPLVRVGMTTGRIRELITALEETLSMHQKMIEAGGEGQ